MKKMKLILASLFTVMFITSCTKDGGDSVIDTQNGGLPNIAKVANSDQSINLAALNNGDDINLSFTVDIARGDVASMDIVGIYKQGTSVQKTTLNKQFSFENFLQLICGDFLDYKEIFKASK